MSKLPRWAYISAGAILAAIAAGAIAAAWLIMHEREKTSMEIQRIKLESQEYEVSLDQQKAESRQRLKAERDAFNEAVSRQQLEAERDALNGAESQRNKLKASLQSSSPSSPQDSSSNHHDWEQLAKRCKDSFAHRLRDPESIRILEAKGSRTQGTNSKGQPYDQSILIVFTATNAYGGRVKGLATCEFYRGSMNFTLAWG